QGNGNTPELELTGYPNPFSENVTLNYNLPETGTVIIKVYNAIGELIDIITNEDLATGRYTIDYSGRKLSKGMYTFRLDFIGEKTSSSVVLKMVK
ncbi:MAG: T9SS type A sorting domain-containing protein, partial [Bacteroidales bacterium]